MSTTAVPLLALMNLALIGLLPRIFFRRGRLTAAWWVTAAPFIAAAGALLASMAGAMTPMLSPSQLRDGFALVLAVGSIFLIGVTLACHSEPLSLWHQRIDRPERLVSHGPYAYIRHPFYTAFLAAQLAAFLALPHWVTAAAGLAAWARLSYTARLEEQNFLASRLAGEYAEYRSTTGRFMPRPRLWRD
jgi:protein-S-isoprenylcysteine O-methyltransferase Ste14